MPHQQTTGTRAQVYHGTAKHTSGGLHKSDLMQNKAGRIVSRRKHNSAKKEMRLVKHGYGTKKGKFGFVKMNKSKSRKHRRHKGGSGMSELNPADIEYQMSMPQVMDGGAPYGQSFNPSDLDAEPMKGGKRRMRSMQQQRSKQQQQQRQRQQQKQRQQQVAGTAELNDSYMLGK
jgi:hypothetical protein